MSGAGMTSPWRSGPETHPNCEGDEWLPTGEWSTHFDKTGRTFGSPFNNNIGQKGREGQRNGPGASTRHLIGALELLPAVLHIFGKETPLFSQLYQPN
jgi:hypothetical protein